MRIDAERIGVDAYTKSQKNRVKITEKTPPLSKKNRFDFQKKIFYFIYNQNTPHMCTSIFITYYSIKSAKNSIFYKKIYLAQIRNINTDTK